MQYEIPGQGQLTIKTIILDLNGTLSVGGTVKPRLDKLKLFVDSQRLIATLRK
jgi:hypothetical protein